MNINIDMQDLDATTAKSLDHMEIASLLPPYRFSTTEAVQERMLLEKVQEKLNQLERQLMVEEDDIATLDTFISYLPQESSHRTDAEFRVKQIREIHTLNHELESLSERVNDAEYDMSLVDQLQTIQSRVKACLNSPLKQKLLNTIEEMTTTHDIRQPSSLTEKQPIHTLETMEDLDNHLIGLMIAEYIDLDTHTRTKIARRIYDEQQFIGITDDELASKVHSLVEEYKASSHQLETENSLHESKSTCLLITDKTVGIDIVDGQIRLP